jgi:hypothetical protein
VSLTPERLYELQNLHQGTTPGPWRAVPSRDPMQGAYDVGIRTDGLPNDKDHLAMIGEVWAERERGRPDSDAAMRDASWIVAAHEAFPALLEEISTLRIRLESLESEPRG